MHQLTDSKILVVEDDPKMCESIQVLLNVHGFDVQTSATLSEARHALKDENFDVILLDLKLRDQSGFALMDHLMERHLDTRVIVVTGQHSEKHAITALKKGATDYLKKPFEPNELIESVNTVLDRHRYQRELELFKHVVETSSAAIVVGNPEGQIVYSNSAFYKLIHAESAVAGTLPTSDENTAATDEQIRNVLETGIPWKGKADLAGAGGKRLVVCKLVDPIPEPIGGTSYGIALMCDMTAQLEKVRTVANSRERYRKVIDSQQEFLYRLNSDLLFTFVNQAYAATWGVTPRSMMGIPITAFAQESIQPMLLETIKAVRSGSTPAEIEFQVADRDGRSRWQQWRFEVIRSATDRLMELQGVGRDVTHKKRIEKDIAEKKEKFRNLAEITSDWLWELNIDGVYTYTSPVVSDLLGYAAQEVLGKSTFAFMPADEAQRVKLLFEQALAAGEPIKNIENINQHKDGSRIILETSGVPILDEAGVISGYRGVSRDISVRKCAEKRLQEESDKLKQALAKVKRLSGMLPICASCKKIRDDSGYWNQIEEYIENNSDAAFSHGICPECARKLYPELYD